MEKFVLVTRGRTGSTAVLDELGKSRVLFTAQELFTRSTPTDKQVNDYYKHKLLPPFDIWKKRGWWWKRMFPGNYSDPRQAYRYLLFAEKFVQRQGTNGFGWKVLSHHFDERPYLAALLKQHGHRVVYLRRNIARQVLSGRVARQRGIYNSREKVVDEHRYHINIDEYQWHVKFERECVKNDCAKLSAEGFDFVEVNYEDYCDNREVFFDKIFNLLNLPLELPPPSDFQKMIEDPRRTIENYDEVAKVAAELGERL